jgi:hypothetical protein
MCCFSGKVRRVSATNIFAKSAASGRQVVVYQMFVDAKDELAMILPLPVAMGSGEHALRFISLQEYPAFFQDMAKGFAATGRSKGFGGLGSASSGALEVVSVGEFEASYVPTVRDFGRLDPRFRLPDGSFEQLPQYKNYGFAVFKLKPGATTVHPMAFSFPRRDPRALFFPTIHIHDGKVHATATFDHTLYCQKYPSDTFKLTNWTESPSLSHSFMPIDKTQGLVASGLHCYSLDIHGRRRNEDTILT